jgi:hypothetical protein
MRSERYKSVLCGALRSGTLRSGLPEGFRCKLLTRRAAGQGHALHANGGCAAHSLHGDDMCINGHWLRVRGEKGGVCKLAGSTQSIDLFI